MYYLVYILGLFLSLKQTKWKNAYLIFALALLMLAMFRYGFGPDYFAYRIYYYEVSPNILIEILNTNARMEPLFRLIAVFFRFFKLDFQWFISLFAIIDIYFLVKLVKRYSANISLSLLLYFSFFFFSWICNTFRQGTVIIVGLYYLLECLERNNIRKFLFIIIILTLLHGSAIFLVFLYFVGRHRFNRKQLLIILIISMVFSLIPINNFIMRSTWIPFFRNIQFYLVNPSMSGETLSINLLNFKSIGRYFFLGIGFIFYKKFSEENENQQRIINIYVVSLILYFVLQFSELVAARLSIYGFTLAILILPNSVKYLNAKVFRNYFYIGLIILSFTFMYKELYSISKLSGIEIKDKYFFPYTNIFDKRYALDYLE